MITFDHVTKKYRTNIGLDDVSVHIHKGDFVFLVGPSGAGKSTFIKLILKEIDADEGTIQVGDFTVTELSNREIPQFRRKVGTVFQDFRLLPKKTVFENVAFAMEVLHKTPRQIRKQVPQILQDQSRKKGATVVIVTHNSAIAPMADRVIEIKNGKCQRVRRNENPVSVETIEW